MLYSLASSFYFYTLWNDFIPEHVSISGIIQNCPQVMVQPSLWEAQPGPGFAQAYGPRNPLSEHKSPLKPLNNIGKVSVNASILYNNQEICNKTNLWKCPLISLFLLRENSKNAF